MIESVPIERRHNSESALDDDGLYDCKATCAILGGNRPIHFSTLYKGIRVGRFPKPVKIGPATSRWRGRDLRECIMRLAEARL